VRADPRQVQQALTNLVGNALEHGAGVVRLSVRPDGDALAIVVADEGPGFDHEILAHATERFMRSAGSTGAGLGLAIAMAVAEANHGSVGLGNIPGGAEAWLSLPEVPVPVSAPVG